MNNFAFFLCYVFKKCIFHLKGRETESPYTDSFPKCFQWPSLDGSQAWRQELNPFPMCGGTSPNPWLKSLLPPRVYISTKWSHV